jgi:hypothetical protein
VRKRNAAASHEAQNERMHQCQRIKWYVFTRYLKANND